MNLRLLANVQAASQELQEQELEELLEVDGADRGRGWWLARTSDARGSPTERANASERRIHCAMPTAALPDARREGWRRDPAV